MSLARTSAQASAPLERIDSLLRQAAAGLAPLCDSPRLDAELLLAAVLGCSRGQLLARGDQMLDADQHQRFQALLQRRLGGEPVAYLLECREFWSLDLRVTPAVLIPRPETELLVELALKRVEHVQVPRVLDLGTGSGAIALALARERPDAQLTATDRSSAALEVARDNAMRLGCSQIHFVCSDWFADVPAQGFDLIVSNPPYVAVDDPALQAAVGAHEPAAALYAGADGLTDLTAITASASAYIEPGGFLLLEHGTTQAAVVCSLLQQAGFIEVQNWRDLAGHPRCSGGQRA